MKNYYEILEVDKKASSEVIEKAYRALVKKYHPDLQVGEKRIRFAEKLKDINEAYEVLSNDYKRTTYDEQLQKATISKIDYEKVIHENEILKDRLRNNNNQKQNNTNIQQEVPRFQDSDNTIINMGRILGSQFKNVGRQINQNKQTKSTSNRIFKVKHDAKFYKKIIIYALIVILVCLLIYQIPPVKNFFTQLYEKNIIFKSIIDVFINTFASGF